MKEATARRDRGQASGGGSMTIRREAPTTKSPAPTRTEIEAEVPGAKSTEPKNDDQRRAEHEQSRRGLEPDEEPC